MKLPTVVAALVGVVAAAPSPASGNNTTITPEDICGARGGPECLKWAKECMTETAQMASMHVDRAGAEMAYCAFKKNTQAKIYPGEICIGARPGGQGDLCHKRLGWCALDEIAKNRGRNKREQDMFKQHSALWLLSCVEALETQEDVEDASQTPVRSDRCKCEKRYSVHGGQEKGMTCPKDYRDVRMGGQTYCTQPACSPDEYFMKCAPQKKEV